MASNDTVAIFKPAEYEYQSASQATFDTRNNHLILDFSDSSSEVAVFSTVMPSSYADGGIIIRSHVAFTSATAGSGLLNFYFERIGNELADLDTDEFSTATSMAIDVPPTSGSVVITTINIPDGAGVDNIAAGESYRLKAERDSQNATDTASGDLELTKLELREL